MFYVVASSPLDLLVECLGRLTVPFRELPEEQTAVNPRIDGYLLVAGEDNKLAYFIEDHGTIFASCWDLLARTARELDALVIGSLYEASEQHCEFFAARGPQMIRAFWSNPYRTTRPFSQGDPLPSEAVIPLSAAGGRGLVAALKGFGFRLGEDADRDLLPGERRLLWKGDLAAVFEEDPWREPVNNHVRAFANPVYRPPEPIVRVRRMSRP
jgi:hypothetical protein